MRLCRLLGIVIGVAALSTAAGAAKAAVIDYNFYYYGAGLDFDGDPYAVFTSGMLMTQGPLTSNHATIIGITGERNGVAITGLAPTGTFAGNDDRLNKASPYLDFGGFSYSAGGNNYNVFFGDGMFVPGYGECSVCGGTDEKPIVFALGVVPLPGAATLFALAISGTAGLRRLRRRNAEQDLEA